jgi:hypothetical protein
MLVNCSESEIEGKMTRGESGIIEELNGAKKRGPFHGINIGYGICCC